MVRSEQPIAERLAFLKGAGPVPRTGSRNTRSSYAAVVCRIGNCASRLRAGRRASYLGHVLARVLTLRHPRLVSDLHISIHEHGNRPHLAFASAWARINVLRGQAKSDAKQPLHAREPLEGVGSASAPAERRGRGVATPEWERG